MNANIIFRNTYAYIIILGKSILLSNKHSVYFIYNNIYIIIYDISKCSYQFY